MILASPERPSPAYSSRREWRMAASYSSVVSAKAAWGTGDDLTLRVSMHRLDRFANIHVAVAEKNLDGMSEES